MFRSRQSNALHINLEWRKMKLLEQDVIVRAKEFTVSGLMCHIIILNEESIRLSRQRCQSKKRTVSQKYSFIEGSKLHLRYFCPAAEEY
eukprot:scaffold11571_cov122-Cylindrotheca_fusiformis.AAC.14